MVLGRKIWNSRSSNPKKADPQTWKFENFGIFYIVPRKNLKIRNSNDWKAPILKHGAYIVISRNSGSLIILIRLL